MCSAWVQSRICLPAGHMWWRGGACTGQWLWVAQGQPQPQGVLAGLHCCTCAATLEMWSVQAALELLVWTWRGTWTNWDIPGKIVMHGMQVLPHGCLGRWLREPQYAISYSQTIDPPSAEEASPPQRNRKLWNMLICPESQNSNQKFCLWVSDPLSSLNFSSSFCRQPGSNPDLAMLTMP